MSFGITAGGWLALGASAAGTIYSTKQAGKAAQAQADAAEKNAQLTTAAADRAAELQDRQYQQTRQDQLSLLAQQRADTEGYRTAGNSALASIMAGLSPTGEFRTPGAVVPVMDDAGYKFRQEEGQRGILRAAATGGTRYSGATLKALARYNSGLASQEYGDAYARGVDAYNRATTEQGQRFNRLASVAGLGQTALDRTQQAGTSAYGTLASLGAQNAGNQGNIALAAAGAAGKSAQDAAESRASGYVATGNLINSGIRNLYNILG